MKQVLLSVPLFWNEDDLPIGVLFMGRFGDEAMLFRLASLLETGVVKILVLGPLTFILFLFLF
jgi:Asp-tRNA(Asn)/Glu-tRNA(Gln) amidotransferase A subunit family amidase